MKLNQLASKPQLVKLTLDDAETVKEYNEPIEFWTYDRQPMDVFVKLAQLTTSDVGEIISIVRTMILDEKGKAIIVDDVTLPTPVLIRAVAKITELLGN